MRDDGLHARLLGYSGFEKATIRRSMLTFGGKYSTHNVKRGVWPIQNGKEKKNGEQK